MTLHFAFYILTISLLSIFVGNNITTLLVVSIRFSIKMRTDVLHNTGEGISQPLRSVSREGEGIIWTDVKSLIPLMHLKIILKVE